MADEGWLAFHGRAQRDVENDSIRVFTDSRAASGSFELSGFHAQAAALAIEAAATPIRPAVLKSKLAQEAELSEELAAELLQGLIGCGILQNCVTALARISVLSQCAVSDALRSYLDNAKCPVDQPPCTVAVLGTLGSAGWHGEFRRLSQRGEAILTCSLERAAAFIGPWIGVANAPCPACLAARRWAVDPEFVDASSTWLHQPSFVDTLCSLILTTAAIRDPASVVHVSDVEVTTRPLLKHPDCVCAHRSTPTPEAIERTFRAVWSEERSEPSEQERRAFLDPVLGPLQLHEFSYPELIRGLPLILGSIRLVRRDRGQLTRHDLASVTFGTGASAERRRLVAFAEGIERYAGSLDRPDVRAQPYSALREHAASPADTIRFAPEQYAPLGAQLRYEDQKLDWSWVYDLCNDRPALVPHDAIALARVVDEGTAQLYHEPFSSGFAAHRTLPLAVERALIELMERDAFMKAWYLRLPLNELALPQALDPWLDEMLTYLRAKGVSLRFFDLRVDFALPCVLAIATALDNFGPWKNGGVLLSASGGSSLLGAARHAVEELLGHYSVFAVVAAHQELGIDPSSGAARDWWPAMAAYLEPRTDAPFSFLEGRPKLEISPEDAQAGVSELLPSILEQLRARSLPAWVRLVPVESSALIAVRAFVPGLVRLAVSREVVNLGEQQLSEVASRWGVECRLNPLSHPLA